MFVYSTSMQGICLYIAPICMVHACTHHCHMVHATNMQDTCLYIVPICVSARCACTYQHTRYMVYILPPWKMSICTCHMLICTTTIMLCACTDMTWHWHVVYTLYTLVHTTSMQSKCLYVSPTCKFFLLLLCFGASGHTWWCSEVASDLGNHMGCWRIKP